MNKKIINHVGLLQKQQEGKRTEIVLNKTATLLNYGLKNEHKMWISSFLHRYYYTHNIITGCRYIFKGIPLLYQLSIF